MDVHVVRSITKSNRQITVWQTCPIGLSSTTATFSGIVRSGRYSESRSSAQRRVDFPLCRRAFPSKGRYRIQSLTLNSVSVLTCFAAYDAVLSVVYLLL